MPWRKAQEIGLGDKLEVGTRGRRTHFQSGLWRDEGAMCEL